MFSSSRRHFSYANVVATLALFFAMSGGALAAKHYLINSTKQINPKVLKKLKGNSGKTGPAGPAGAAGATGPAGANGTNGTNGANGAVAGYSASQSGTATISEAEEAEHVTATVVSKTLPAGSYIVTGQVELIYATIATDKSGYARVICTLSDPTAGVSDKADFFAVADTPTFLFSSAETVVPLSLAFSTASASTATIKCEDEFSDSEDSGKVIAVSAHEARVNAVQVTGVS